MNGHVLMLVALIWCLYAIIVFFSSMTTPVASPEASRGAIPEGGHVTSKFKPTEINTDCFSSRDLQPHTSFNGNESYYRQVVKERCAEEQPDEIWGDDAINSHTTHSSQIKFSIICNSFNRPEFLLRSIEHYTRCSGLDTFNVVWCDGQDVSIPNSILQMHHDTESGRRGQRPGVKIVRRRNSLNERFTALAHQWNPQHAVLSLDDDVLISCSDVGMMHRAYLGPLVVVD
jgi:hypothetical protein